jgi:hypothetical protein
VTAPGQVVSSTQDQASPVHSSSPGQAGNVKHSTTSAASEVASTSKEQVSNVVGETVQQAKDVTGQLKEQARQQLDTQSSRAVQQVRSVSEQLTNGDTSGWVGELLSEAGQRLQQLSGYVEQAGPQGVVDDLRRYARRSPGTFVLGAALAGLVGGRVLKGVQASQSSTQTGRDVTPPSNGGLADPYPATPPAGAYQGASSSRPTLLPETRYGGSL